MLADPTSKLTHSPSHSPVRDVETGKENTRPGLAGKPAERPMLSPSRTSSARQTPPPDGPPALTEAAVKTLVRQQRQFERQGLITGYDHTADGNAPLGPSTGLSPTPQHHRHATEPNSLAVNGATQGLASTGLLPYHSRHPTDVTQQRKSTTPDADGDAESEGEQTFLSPRMRVWVESYLDSLKGITFADDAGTSADISEESDRAQLDHRIRFMARDTLRTMVLDFSDELVDALHELIALDEKVAELDDDNAHLELQLGRKQENVDMLQVQLSASDDCVAALMNEKQEALRKLTEAKGELALIGARNAKLQKQISAHTGDDVSRNSCELGRTLNMLSADNLASTQDNDNEALLGSKDSAATQRTRQEENSPAPGSRLVVEAATRSVAEAQKRLDIANTRIAELEKAAAEREKTIAQLEARQDTTARDEKPRSPPLKDATDADRRLRRLSTHPQCSDTSSAADSDSEDGEERPGVGERRKPRKQTPSPPPPAGAPAVPPQTAAVEESAAQTRVNNVWRRMYEEGVLRVGRLEREVERLKTAAATASLKRPTSPSDNEPTQAAAAAAATLAETTALRQETQKLREALSTEQDRARRLASSENELLTQVADLARKLREKENTERSLRSQRRADASATREERVAEFTGAVARRSSEDVIGSGDGPLLQRASKRNSAGANSDADRAARRRRSDVLKAFEDVKQRAIRPRSTVISPDASPALSPAPEDSQEMSYSPAAPLAKPLVQPTHSPSPPKHRPRASSLLAPPGNLRKSISDALMNSQSGTHEGHLISSVSSLASPHGPPAGSGFQAFTSPAEDPPLDSSANVFHAPRLSLHGRTSSGQANLAASALTLPPQQQATPRRSTHNNSGGALPAPVRVPIRTHPSACASGATTPRGTRDRPLFAHTEPVASINLSATTNNLPSNVAPTPSSVLAGGTASVSRRGITRGVSQDRAPRRRSASQTVGVSGAKPRSPSIRAGAGPAPVTASRRP